MCRLVLDRMRFGGPSRVQLHQLDLHVALGLPRPGGASPPATLRVELPRALIVGERPFQSVHQLAAQLGRFDRRRELHPVVEVTRHQVR